jgi:hypothetical protein
MIFAFPQARGTLQMALEPGDPPRLRVDTNCDGDFSDERAFVGRIMPRDVRQGAQPTFRFGVISLGAVERRKGPGVPAVAEWTAGQPFVWLSPEGWRTGRARFGKRAYQVAVLDGNYDGKYDGALSLETSGGRWGSCDYFAIDLNNDGRFDYDYRDFRRMEAQPLTKMLEVEGTYYQIKVTVDGSDLSVSKAKPDFGKLDVGSPEVELILLSDSGLHRIDGAQREWKLPVGTHMAMSAALSSRGGRCRLRGAGNMGKLGSIRIEADRTTKLTSGPPLTLKTDARNAQGVVSVGLTIVGRAGEVYSAGAEENGRQLPAPRLRILDERGRIAAQGAFEYG